MKNLSVTVLLALSIFIPAGARAAEYEVKMLNKGSDGQAMTFEPAFLHIQPGDTVHFMPVDKGHNVDTIPGMLPDGAAPLKGAISHAVDVTFQQPGLYGYRCMPHFGMGMVGLIEVGNTPVNQASAQQAKLPPLAKKRMDTLVSQVQ
ncbi:pseudoazurin [Rhizobium mayense]|uniref:Pseudoazurin n=1 Tax=Rhizobium mayense TaxID=1312184 RepID=A0ABT7JYZ7_9HYPH|nr:pseudoazurin [Rhizobium mayense]MDL2401013.1 pseudoazurin [Rhizobium mayense]